jgi:hypothetical protein
MNLLAVWVVHMVCSLHQQVPICLLSLDGWASGLLWFMLHAASAHVSAAGGSKAELD